MPRYSPFEEMEQLFEQMRRSMWDGYEFTMRTPSLEAGRAEDDTNLSTERYDDEYVVVVDIPGFETDEIDVRINDGVLTITGTHDADGDDDAVRNRRHRRVHERVRIPSDVDEDEVSASYRNGVLEVHLPSTEALTEEGRRVEIE